ncbi:hypothetical protein D082_32970 [Synechocystis sp. PCC 6714]|nr:hypothetical protein D082_32970 [Synechocystis sp. PCC 6714]
MRPFGDERDSLPQAQIPAVYRPYTRHIEQICQCECKLFYPTHGESMKVEGKNIKVC